MMMSPNIFFSQKDYMGNIFGYFRSKIVKDSNNLLSDSKNVTHMKSEDFGFGGQDANSSYFSVKFDREPKLFVNLSKIERSPWFSKVLSILDSEYQQGHGSEKGKRRFSIESLSTHDENEKSVTIPIDRIEVYGLCYRDEVASKIQLIDVSGKHCSEIICNLKTNKRKSKDTSSLFSY